MVIEVVPLVEFEMYKTFSVVYVTLKQFLVLRDDFVFRLEASLL